MRSSLTLLVLAILVAFIPTYEASAQNSFGGLRDGSFSLAFADKGVLDFFDQHPEFSRGPLFKCNSGWYCEMDVTRDHMLSSSVDEADEKLSISYRSPMQDGVMQVNLEVTTNEFQVVQVKTSFELYRNGELLTSYAMANPLDCVKIDNSMSFAFCQYKFDLPRLTKASRIITATSYQKTQQFTTVVSGVPADKLLGKLKQEYSLAQKGWIKSSVETWKDWTGRDAFRINDRIACFAWEVTRCYIVHTPGVAKNPSWLFPTFLLQVKPYFQNELLTGLRIKLNGATLHDGNCSFFRPEQGVSNGHPAPGTRDAPIVPCGYHNIPIKFSEIENLLFPESLIGGAVAVGWNIPQVNRD